MGLPVFKDCCCLELKWGALIVAIVDLIFGGSVLGQAEYLGASHSSDLVYILWIILLIVTIAHIVACILVIISVFVENKNLVILYLITAIIRFIFEIILLIIVIIKFGFRGDSLVTIILLIIYLCLAVYMWLVIYSWFRKLGGSTPVD